MYPEMTFVCDFINETFTTDVAHTAFNEIMIAVALGESVKSALRMWVRTWSSQSNANGLVDEYKEFCSRNAHAWQNWEGYNGTLQEVAYAAFCDAYN